MARKEKKYHFIYKTTNVLSGKYYIGMHSTDDLNDGYLGSGNRIRLAIRKHGKENFKREILEFCNSREKLKIREEEIVNLNEIGKVECMNLKVGGEGDWPKSANERFKWLLENDDVFKDNLSKKHSERNLRLIKEGVLKSWDYNYSWVGKQHSEETKQKMGESSKGTGVGETNSQYDTCWITKDGENKKIKKEGLEIFIIDGWELGRISKIKGEEINNSKLTSNDVIKIKQLLLDKSIKQNKIGDMFGVKQETISKIKRGLIWKHI